MPLDLEELEQQYSPEADSEATFAPPKLNTGKVAPAAPAPTVAPLGVPSLDELEAQFSPPDEDDRPAPAQAAAPPMTWGEAAANLKAGTHELASTASRAAAWLRPLRYALPPLGLIPENAKDLARMEEGAAATAMAGQPQRSWATAKQSPAEFMRFAAATMYRQFPQIALTSTLGILGAGAQTVEGLSTTKKILTAVGSVGTPMEIAEVQREMEKAGIRDEGAKEWILQGLGGAAGGAIEGLGELGGGLGDLGKKLAGTLGKEAAGQVVRAGIRGYLQSIGRVGWEITKRTLGEGLEEWLQKWSEVAPLLGYGKKVFTAENLRDANESFAAGAVVGLGSSAVTSPMAEVARRSAVADEQAKKQNARANLAKKLGIGKTVQEAAKAVSLLEERLGRPPGPADIFRMAAVVKKTGTFTPGAYEAGVEQAENIQEQQQAADQAKRDEDAAGQADTFSVTDRRPKVEGVAPNKPFVSAARVREFGFDPNDPTILEKYNVIPEAQPPEAPTVERPTTWEPPAPATPQPATQAPASTTSPAPPVSQAMAWGRKMPASEEHPKGTRTTLDRAAFEAIRTRPLWTAPPEAGERLDARLIPHPLSNFQGNKNTITRSGATEDLVPEGVTEIREPFAGSGYEGSWARGMYPGAKRVANVFDNPEQSKDFLYYFHREARDNPEGLAAVVSRWTREILSLPETHAALKKWFYGTKENASRTDDATEKGAAALLEHGPTQFLGPKQLRGVTTYKTDELARRIREHSLMLSGAEIGRVPLERGKVGAIYKGAGEGTWLIDDPPYLEVTGYHAKGAWFESLDGALWHVRNNVATAVANGAKVLYHNTWHADLVAELENMGFQTRKIKVQCRPTQGRNYRYEVLAWNYPTTADSVGQGDNSGEGGHPGERSAGWPDTTRLPDDQGPGGLAPGDGTPEEVPGRTALVIPPSRPERVVSAEPPAPQAPATATPPPAWKPGEVIHEPPAPRKRRPMPKWFTPDVADGIMAELQGGTAERIPKRDENGEIIGWMGYNTNPDWFRNSGYDKATIAATLRNWKQGKALTAKQQDTLDWLVQAQREERFGMLRAYRDQTLKERAAKQKAAGGDKYSAVGSGRPRGPMTLQEMQERWPEAKVATVAKGYGGGFRVTMPNGVTLTYRETGYIDMDPIAVRRMYGSNASLRDAAARFFQWAHQRAGVIEWTPSGRDQIGHEEGHAAATFVLSNRELAALKRQNTFGSKHWEENYCDKLNEAFRLGKRPTDTLLRKVWDFILRLVHSIHPTTRSTNEEIISGRVWHRPGRTVEDDIAAGRLGGPLDSSTRRDLGLSHEAQYSIIGKKGAKRLGKKPEFSALWDRDMTPEERRATPVYSSEPELGWAGNLISKRSKDEDARYSLAGPAARFYSMVDRVIEDKMPNRASADQVKALLTKTPGIKQEELADRGVLAFLEGKQAVTKAEVQDFLRENATRLDETVKKSGTPMNEGELRAQLPKQFAKLDEANLIPAETVEYDDLMFNDTETGELLSVKDIWEYRTRAGEGKYSAETAKAAEAIAEAWRPLVDTTKYSRWQMPGGSNYREVLVGTPAPDWWHEGRRDYPSEAAKNKTYISPHWEEPNVLGHLRMNDRTLTDGRKALHVEEFQSDWHQKGRKEGYGTLVPDAPFKKSWPRLLAKRALAEAIEGGYDTLTWTTGDTQADRYDLSKQVDQITIKKRADDSEWVVVGDKNGRGVLGVGVPSLDKLADYIGKDLAARAQADLAKTENEYEGVTYSGVDLKVGGEGMKSFYDRTMVNEFNDLAKKYGGRVTQTEIDTTNENTKKGGPVVWQRAVWSLDITPAMRESVRSEGQSMYSIPDDPFATAARVWQQEQDEKAGRKPTKPTAGTEQPGLSVVQSSAVEKLVAALKGAKPILRRQRLLYSEERAKRFAMAANAKGQGREQFYRQLGTLKGELPKVQFESIEDRLSAPDIDELFNAIEQHPYLTIGEKISAKEGLEKLLGAHGMRYPARSEIKLLNEVFPPEFTQTLLDKAPMLQRVLQGVLKGLTLPKELMASADLSAAMRQGAFLIGRPRLWLPAAGAQFKYAFSEGQFKALLEDIRSRPNYKTMRKAGLAITDIGALLENREEAFASTWGEKVPVVGHGVRGSARAYTGFLDKVRADYFDAIYRQAKKMGIEDERPDIIYEIADYVNTATGRGSLGKLNRVSAELNAAFFSPRLMASRVKLLNPVYYVKMDPLVRKIALRDLMAFASTVGLVVGLAKMGGADVEDDPRSADFGKIKIGKTRYDLWGGFQQYIRLGAQLITGEMISTTTGREIQLGEGYRPLSRMDVLLNFLKGKESPIASFATDMATGKTGLGEDVNVPAEVIDRFIPMVAQDAYDIYRERGADHLWMGIPGIFGVGMQTYGSMIPMEEKTPTGQPTVKWRQEPGLGETILNKVTGNEVSNIPQEKWGPLAEAKRTETLRDIEVNKAKAFVLATGEPQQVGATRIWLENGVVKTKRLDKNEYNAELRRTLADKIATTRRARRRIIE